MKNKLQILLFVTLMFSGLFAQTNTEEVHKNLKLDCKFCHVTESFEKIEFDHSNTGFELVGKHKFANCKACHSISDFSKVSENCSSCHTDVHNSTLGEDCLECHNFSNFNSVSNLRFHDEKTNFPLKGSHQFLDCEVCHKESKKGIFVGQSNDCVSCHLKDFLSAESPNHVEANYSSDCTICHSSKRRGWGGGNFVHDFFPLKGVHKISDCGACHTSENFSDASSDCYSCHKVDFENAQNPNHVQSQFSTNCETCHNTTNFGWKPATFVHTNFPLTGVHKISDCSACHTTTNFSDASSDCYSCHKVDFENSQNPNHVQAQFSTNCETCHNTTNFGWKPATFDHSIYPLSGVHAKLDCAACHVNNVYLGTPRDCISCHQTEFQNAQNPSHNSFPTDCTVCHNFNAWKPATISNHDSQYFPIYSGKHKKVWGSDCSTCHTNPSDFNVFSCFAGCHEHNQSKMNSEHDDVGGYVYESNACYNCHPNGKDSPSWNRKRGYNEN